MTPEAFARVESLFHAAMALSPERRRQFLQETEANPTIRDAVQRLLDSEAEGHTNPLSKHLAHVLRSATAPPRMISDYRVLRDLGSGGMGTVFLAERDVHGVAQQVAVKLLHGLPTETGKRRMALERSLLAGLNHPQIAGHIDGGETADGEPYLVMEYVDGVPLPEHLETVRPDLAARLHLFLGLCQAVAHAHQRLVLHRDLKPSNVIVRADGTPVLVDFGVGKLLEEGTSGAGATTATRVFTPGYGAPEQRRGQAATTATDVFGLGTVLFDLLTDRRLPTLRSDEAPVPPPSDHVSDASRRRALRGDLDRIVRKATAEEPAQRYPTVAALAEDVQRYLDGRPVTAAPPAFAYRVRKFVMRHRWAVAAALLLVVLTGAFVWRLELERQRAIAAERVAAREAMNANASRDFLVSVLGEVSPENRRGETITMASLLATAVTKLQADSSQDPQTRASAWVTIGEVYVQVNDPKAALRAADAALVLLKQSDAADLELQARAFRVRGTALAYLERHAEARKALRHAITLRERQGADAVTLSRAYYDYGGAAMRRGELDTARESMQHALKLLDSAERAEPGRLRVEVLFDLFSTHMLMRDLTRAHGYLIRAEAAARTTLDADDVSWYFLRLGSAQLNRIRGNYRVALRRGEEALRLAYRLFGQDSRRTAAMEREHAALLYHMGRPRDAIRHLERGRTIIQDLKLGAASVALFDSNLALFYDSFGDGGRAIELADSALAALPNDRATARFRSTAHQARGHALSRLGRFAEAQRDFERALELLRGTAGDEGQLYGRMQMAYGRSLIRAGRWSDAAHALDTAERTYISKLDSQHPDRIKLTHLRAWLALERGGLANASQWIAQAVSQGESGAMDALPLAQMKLTAARVALEQQDAPRARRLLREVLPVLRQQLSPKAPQLAQAERLARTASS